MSFGFHASLEENALPAMPATVVFGSVTSLRHQGVAGGYLNSRDKRYCSGSLQQQITVYNYKDPNSFWLLESRPRLEVPQDDHRVGGRIYNGATIRLRHQSTRLHLPSHDVLAPVRGHNEVSAYGNEGLDGDDPHLLKVDIIQSLSASPTAGEYLRTHDSIFRLLPVKTGRSLFSNRDRLPPWGACHHAVTCPEPPLYSTWSVEDNELPHLLSNDDRVGYSPSTSWSKFVEYQKVAGEGTPSFDKIHTHFR
jgi:dolichyl-phosphate-mannose-protein mannosyltransferase